MKKTKLLSLGLALGLAFTSAPSYAEAELGIMPARGVKKVLAKSVSIKDLKDRSGTAFLGKVKSYEYAQENGFNVIKVTFNVLDGIKGIAPEQKEITITQLAALSNPYEAMKISGESRVMFMYPASSEFGLCSPVAGEDQGTFKMSGDKPIIPSRVMAQSKSDERVTRLATAGAASKSLEDVNSYDDLKAVLQSL